ncbi:MAG: site-specific DNA-methyltransferase [Halobacteria archaeon]
MTSPRGEIHCKDSRDLSELRGGSVQLTVTSPPYRNAIDYEVHQGEPGGWYRGARLFTTESYLQQMEEHFLEVWRVTREGGFCCIVIGNELDNGNLVPLPHLLTARLLKKWNLHEEIIWYKVTGGKKRFAVTVQHPYPTYYYPNILHEHILIFRKGEKVLRKEESSRYELDDLMTREIANSAWHIAPVPPNYLPHPCPFPEEIPHRLITLYSSRGDVVLDNFNGIGQTTKVAKHLGRRFAGYDISEKYCAIARKRLSEPLHIRDYLIPKWVKAKSVLAVQRLPTETEAEIAVRL